MNLSVDSIVENVIAQAPAVAVLVLWLHRRLARVERLIGVRNGSDPPPPSSTVIRPPPATGRAP